MHYLISVVLLLLIPFSTQSLAEDEINTVTQRLLGRSEYPGCSAPQVEFLKDASKYGRIASVSASFEACVSNKVMDGTYRRCPSDPFASSPRSTQIEKVMAVATAPNRVQHTCVHNNSGGNASAGFLRYAHDSTVSFAWKNWLDGVVEQLPKPVCPEGVRPDSSNHCRFAEFPWPYNQASGTIWHEGMHTHTYDHGAVADRGKSGCGYSPESSYDMWAHSMPYIVGQCVSDAVSTADAACPMGIDSCPGDNQLNMLNADGTTCSCVNDPGMKGLGLLKLENQTIVDVAILPDEQRATGGWRYGNHNTIVGTGDFDGMGSTDILVKSTWGLGILTTDANGGWQTLALKQSGKRIGGWLLNSITDKIEGVGDFDGDGQDEFIIRSGWGIGIIKVNGGELSLVSAAPRNTWLGEWRWDAIEINGSADRIVGVGDMNGDDQDDIVVNSPWGIGVLSLNGDRLTSMAQAPRDSWMGAWRWDARVNSGRDVVESIADFDGNGNDDLLVTSAWGIGVLSVSRGHFRTVLASANGTRFDDWTYVSRRRFDTSRVESTGDFNGDGREDVLLRSNGRIALVTVEGNTFSSLVTASDRQRLGGWLLNTLRDDIMDAGDFDGDGRDDILIRSGWGTGVLSLSSGGLTSKAVKNEALAGSWRVANTDKFLGVGKAYNNRSDMIVVQHVE